MGKKQNKALSTKPVSKKISLQATNGNDTKATKKQKKAKENPRESYGKLARGFCLSKGVFVSPLSPSVCAVGKCWDSANKDEMIFCCELAPNTNRN